MSMKLGGRRMDPDTIERSVNDGQAVWQYNIQVGLTQKRRDKLDKYMGRPVEKRWSLKDGKVIQQVELEEEEELDSVKEG